MSRFVGLDVLFDETSVCVVDGDEKILKESKAKSKPTAIARTVGKHAPLARRIGLKAGGSSSWLCRELTDLDLPVIHMEARHAHPALSMRINKTDNNDPRSLADRMHVGWFKAAHAKTVEAHHLRTMLPAWRRLVDTKR